MFILNYYYGVKPFGKRKMHTEAETLAKLMDAWGKLYATLHELGQLEFISIEYKVEVIPDIVWTENIDPTSGMEEQDYRRGE